MRTASLISTAGSALLLATAAVAAADKAAQPAFDTKYIPKETAAALGVSVRTVEGDWRFIRAFLFDQLTKPDLHK